jgi:hypothetical protein
MAGLISPLWISETYMSITGHGKGYSYNMGSETDMSVIFGFVMLMIWIIAVIPIMIWLCRKCYNIKRVFVSIPVAAFIVCFIIGAFHISIDDFLKQFGLLCSMRG